MHDVPGTYAPIASKVLHMVLYGARAARKDLRKAVNNLAMFISKWSLECDVKLQRLMDYIHSTLKWREINWIGDTIDNVTLDLFPDADFGGCLSGIKINKRMLSLLDWE